MPSEEEKNVFLDSLKKENNGKSASGESTTGAVAKQKKGMSGAALFATLFLLFLLIITLLIFIITVGGAKNPILQSFGIESGQIKEFLKSLVNSVFITLTILLLLVFSIGIFRGVSARKEEKEKRRNSLVFSFVSGGLIFAVVLAWLGMYAYVMSLDASALGAKNRIQVFIDGTELTSDSTEIIAPLTMTFSVEGIAEELTKQKKKIVRYAWDKENDGNFEIDRKLDPAVNLWFTKKGVQQVAVQIEIEGEDPVVKAITFTIDKVQFQASPDNGEIPLKVLFDAGDITEGLSVATFEWDFEGDGIFDENSTSSRIEHLYSEIGVYDVALRLRFQDGQSETYQRTVTVKGATSERIKAVIEATPLSGDAPLRVQFSARKSFSTEGKIMNYLWNFGSGEGELKGDIVQYTFNNPGIYRVELTVENDIGLTHASTVEINVSEQTSSPVATIKTTPKADDNGIIESRTSPLEVTFDASGTFDPDDDIVSYAWDINGDENPDQFGESFTYIFENAGEYPIVLTVKDTAGNTGTASRVVIVGADIIQSIIETSAETGSIPLEISFDGSRSSCGNDCRIIAFSWDFGDGTEPQITGAHTTHTFNSIGTFTVTLEVTTSNGDTMQGTKVIAAIIPPLKACIRPSRTSGEAPVTISFNDCSDGTITGWHWDFGDGYVSEERAPEHTYEKEGIYSVVLSVTDEGGTNSQTSVNITVE